MQHQRYHEQQKSFIHLELAQNIIPPLASQIPFPLLIRYVSIMVSRQSCPAPLQQHALPSFTSASTLKVTADRREITYLILPRKVHGDAGDENGVDECDAGCSWCPSEVLVSIPVHICTGTVSICINRWPISSLWSWRRGQKVVSISVVCRPAAMTIVGTAVQILSPEN